MGWMGFIFFERSDQHRRRCRCIRLQREYELFWNLRREGERLLEGVFGASLEPPIRRDTPIFIYCKGGVGAQEGKPTLSRLSSCGGL